MGMDVYGKNPLTKDGEYFRASIWAWFPLLDLCDKVGASIEGWEFNDGRGLTSQESCNELADRLDALEFKSNEVYARKIDDNSLCVDEKGILLTEQKKKDRLFNGEIVRNACSIDAEHLREFTKFLRYCGGFEIW